MTRKCVLCKGTNYKNTYSFFSAPKDPETRKKWQNAIGIENYAVTDDTYVCSKHFHKEDIITHWVSGVPPHVITIKYKKCRLRPGAVPENDQAAVKERRTFRIPRTGNSSHRDKDHNNRTVTSDYRSPLQSEEYSYTLKGKGPPKEIQLSRDISKVNLPPETELIQKQLPEQNLMQSVEVIMIKEESMTSNTMSMDCTNSKDTMEEENGLQEDDTCSKNSRKTSECSSKMFNTSEGEDTSTEIWESRNVDKNSYCNEKVANTFKTMEDLYIDNQVLNTLSYDTLDVPRYPIYNDLEENDMLFEDLLEIYTEVILPRGWSCLVTSKGHTTTVVYLFMGMTKGGMPFAEKQVFVKSDMVLRCAAVNREINPINHNLIREGRRVRVQTLLDVEELIDEFDQRIVCQGVYDTDECKEINGIKIAYKDGVKWRHVLCPLIVNNDSSRCTRCITLSHLLTQRSKTFNAFRYDPLILVRNQQKLLSLHQIRKRTRKHDRRYDYIKVFKK